MLRLVHGCVLWLLLLLLQVSWPLLLLPHCPVSCNLCHELVGQQKDVQRFVTTATSPCDVPLSAPLLLLRDELPFLLGVLLCQRTKLVYEGFAVKAPCVVLTCLLSRVSPHGKLRDSNLVPRIHHGLLASVTELLQPAFENSRELLLPPRFQHHQLVADGRDQLSEPHRIKRPAATAAALLVLVPRALLVLVLLLLVLLLVMLLLVLVLLVLLLLVAIELLARQLRAR
jgi:hypothetical protein